MHIFQGPRGKVDRVVFSAAGDRVVVRTGGRFRGLVVFDRAGRECGRWPFLRPPDLAVLHSNTTLDAAGGAVYVQPPGAGLTYVRLADLYARPFDPPVPTPEAWSNLFPPTLAAAVSPAGDRVVYAHATGQLTPGVGLTAGRFRDAATATADWSVRTPDGVAPLTWTTDGRRVVAAVSRPRRVGGRPEGVLVVRDGATGRVEFEVEAGTFDADEIAAGAGGGFAVRTGPAILAWAELKPGAGPTVVRGESGRHFTGLAFHPSGRYLAATSNDALVRVFDARTWALAKTFTWHVGRMRSVAFSPDGLLAAAGGDAGKVVVWDFDG